MDPTKPWTEQEAIPHRDIPVKYFQDANTDTTTGVSASEREKRIISNPFLQSLLERRPSDAKFNTPFIKMLSPMVRYSKLPFRVLCRRYGADLAFTPMILAKDINRGSYVTNFAYNIENDPHSSFISIDEFSTAPEDRPLIAQFAANDSIEMAKAVEAFEPFIDGVDLNCGCPQQWVLKEGIGAALSSQPELVQDIITQVRQRLPNSKTVSLKIRLRPNLQETIELVRRAEYAGANWVTIHGRTRAELTKASVSNEAIRLLKSCVSIPVIANGDVTTPDEMCNLVSDTNADGVLCARGALANPAIFCGESIVPVDVMSDYSTIAMRYGGLFAMHQHHLSYMMYGRVSRGDRLLFTKLKSMAGILDFMAQRNWVNWSSLHPPRFENRDENGIILNENTLDTTYYFQDDIVRNYSQLYSPSMEKINYTHYPTLDVLPLSSPFTYSKDYRYITINGEEDTKTEQYGNIADAIDDFNPFYIHQESYFGKEDFRPYSCFLNGSQTYPRLYSKLDEDEENEGNEENSDITAVEEDIKNIEINHCERQPQHIRNNQYNKKNMNEIGLDLFDDDIHPSNLAL